MIRKRSFQLVAKNNISAWDSFEAAFENMVKNKAEIEKTFTKNVWDHNFNEPMNVIVIECSATSKFAKEIDVWAETFDAVFGENPDKIVIDTRLNHRPTRFNDRIYIEHTWFKKEAI
jgi:hypothetical protein